MCWNVSLLQKLKHIGSLVICVYFKLNGHAANLIHVFRKNKYYLIKKKFSLYQLIHLTL